jgi:uncharacterized protein with HEPN domain
MLPKTRKLLSDMAEASDAISEFVANVNLPQFLENKIVRAAVYYEFLIVGEVLSQLRQVEESVADRISEHQRIIGFRNQIIHGYSKVDDEITWRIINDKLPVLRRELRMLLAE